MSWSRSKSKIRSRSWSKSRSRSTSLKDCCVVYCRTSTGSFDRIMTVRVSNGLDTQNPSIETQSDNYLLQPIKEKECFM